MIVIDGNDGTGKTTLVQRLRQEKYVVADRGLPSKMTDIENYEFFRNMQTTNLFIILKCSLETSQKRLLQTGKSLDEKYHNLADLTHYQAKFDEVATILPNCHIIDAEMPAEEVYQTVKKIINEHKFV